LDKLHRYASPAAFKAAAVYLLLIITGICANIFGITLSFGLVFIFGSVIVLVIVYTYGTIWGVLAAAIINGYTYVLWHSNFDILLYTIEAIFVGLLYYRKKKSLVFSDVMYWVLIGSPVAAICYYTFLHMDNVQILAIILKNTINGILNVLIAELIITKVPLKSWILREKYITYQSFEKVFFNLMLLVVLITSLSVAALNCFSEYQQRISYIRMELETESNKVSALAKTWYKKEINDLDKIRMSMLLKTVSIWDNSIITIVDHEDSIVASNNTNTTVAQDIRHKSIDRTDSGDEVHYIKVPEGSKFSSMEGWRNAFYVYEKSIGNGIPWTIIIEKPMDKYLKDMQLSYIRNFLLILLLIILTSIIAIVVARSVSSPVKKLVEVTSYLPKKLYTQQQLEWPDSNISEMNSLVNNFKIMATVIRNILEKINKTNEMFEYIAKHDPLTGLPNKLLYKELIDNALSMATYDDRKIAVIYIDVDRFKRVNDTFGHDKGDQLLVSVSKCLESCVKESCTLFRIGGDEFVLLMPRIENIEEVTRQVNDIIHISQQPYAIDDFEFPITISIGIALYPNDGQDADTLFKNADIAMYRAKESGRNCYKFYSSLADGLAFNKLKLESCLNKALDNDEFVLKYQPKVDIMSRKVTGAEALIRWNSPEHGVVPPSEFIPLAEETGLIQPIGEWAFQKVCTDIRTWESRGLRPVCISVNFSSVQVQKRNFIKHIERIIHDTGVDPSWLEFEVTESTIMQDVDYAVEIIEKIKAMGIKVSLDDFGTGFSSLNYLKSFNIDTLKIDSSFVRDVNTCHQDAAIVRTIINLAKNLKLNVVAEGVETKGQVEFLKAEGCNEIQGYYFYKPLDASEFEELLEKSDLCMDSQAL